MYVPYTIYFNCSLCIRILTIPYIQPTTLAYIYNGIFCNLIILLYICNMKNNKNIERVRKWQKEQKSNGLCIECSNPATGLRCDACNKRRAENRKQKYNEWKEKGLCCQCGKETLNNKNYCEKHYLMQISLKRLGTQSYWKELKLLLEEQNFKCALTGDCISFNDNIELDHILPTTRGGKNNLSNVRWTTKEANRLKQNLVDIELKELCKKILSTI